MDSSRRHRMILVAVIGWTITVLSAACTATGGASGHAGTATAHPHGLTSTSSGVSGSASSNPGEDPSLDVREPLQDYLPTETELSDLQIAEQLLTARCLRRFGFQTTDDAQIAEYMRAQSQAEIEDFGTFGAGRRYGLVSLTLASKYGYHLKSEVDPPAAPMQVPHKRDPQAELNVLSGTTPDGKPLPGALHVPKGGCRGEAERALGTTPEAPSGGSKTVHSQGTLVDQIDLNSFELSQTAPVVVAAIRAWSTCMAASGYHYASPLKAGSDLNLDSARPSPAEVRVAVTDVRCKQRVDLVQIWSGWEAEYERAQIEKHLEYFAQLKQQLADQLSRAAAVLAGR